MKKEEMADLTKSLRDLTDKILSIKFSNEKMYNEFMRRASEIEEELVALEDNTSFSKTTDLAAIKSLIYLESDVNDYLKNGRIVSPEKPKLIFSENQTPSGNELIKQDRINFYRQYTSYISKMDNVDIDLLTKLRLLWNNEKSNYSEIEINVIENAFANAFISYQISECKEKGVFPNENINDYCSIECYESEFKKRLLDHISNLSPDSIEYLEIKNEILNWNIKNLLSNKIVWKELSGREIDFGIIPEEITKNESQSSSKEIKEEEKTSEKETDIISSILPTSLDSDIPTGNAVLIVYQKKKKDGSIVQKQRIKPLDSEGRFKVHFKKDQIVELYFLEGTKELSFIKHGKSGDYAHLSDFPNLKSVYLPSSLKMIEQGYFFDAKSLRNVYLPEGLTYNPNKLLFPENTKIIPHEKTKTEGAIAIEESKYPGIIFRQIIPNADGTISYKPLAVELYRRHNAKIFYKWKYELYHRSFCYRRYYNPCY